MAGAVEAEAARVAVAGLVAAAPVPVLEAVPEPLVVQGALPGVPVGRLELVGELGPPAEWAAAPGQRPEPVLLPDRAGPGLPA